MKHSKIKTALVSRTGRSFRDVRRIAVRPGDVLALRVILEDLQGVQRKETAEFIVPKKFRRSYLIATNGQWEDGSIECLTVPDDCYAGGTETKFDKLLAKIANRPKNNDLIMSLRVGRKSTRVIRSQDQVVSGEEYIRVVRKDGGGGGGGDYEEGVVGKG